MKNIRITTKNILIILLTMALANVYGQQPCGTVATPDDIENMAAYRVPKDYTMPEAPALLPITVQILRTNTGTGGGDSALIMREINRVNALYINANIQFFKCGNIRYINSSFYYDFSSNNQAALTNQYNQAGTINIYFANSVSTSGGQVCGYAYFPTTTNSDHIFIANSCVNGNSSTTLAHELGHYFSLYHTHGTENTAPGTTEYVRRTNCATGGDGLCDTPADPNLYNNLVNTNCQYTGTATDIYNDAYTPLTNNIMSYARPQCKNTFTPQQYARIANGYQVGRAYLACGKLPVGFMSNNTTACQGQAVQYTSSTSPPTPTRYVWSFGGGTPNTSPDPSPIITYATPGIYPATLIAYYNNNYGTITKTNYITITQGLTTTIITTPDTTATPPTGTTTATPTAGGTPPYTYLWNTTPPQTTATITQMPAGTYIVTVRSSEGCTSIDTATILLQLPRTQRYFTLNPNPLPQNYSLNITLKQPDITTIQKLQIFDAIGNIVFQKTQIIPQNRQIQLHNLTLPTGTYTLSIQANNWIASQKLSVF